MPLLIALCARGVAARASQARCSMLRVVLSLLTAVSFSLAQPPIWPQFGGGPTHAGYNANFNPPAGLGVQNLYTQSTAPYIASAIGNGEGQYFMVLRSVTGATDFRNVYFPPFSTDREHDWWQAYAAGDPYLADSSKVTTGLFAMNEDTLSADAGSNRQRLYIAISNGYLKSFTISGKTIYNYNSAYPSWSVNVGGSAIATPLVVSQGFVYGIYDDGSMIFQVRLRVCSSHAFLLRVKNFPVLRRSMQ